MTQTKTPQNHTTAPSGTRLKVGLVGVGGISGAHIPAWEEIGRAHV